MKKIFAIMVVAIATVFSCVTSNAQEIKKESPWVEIQRVDIPAGQTVYEGITKSGNPKFWFEFGELKVNVSPSNAEKYMEGTTVLVLVKWQHNETGKFKYSTRQKSGRVTKVTPNVDITKLF